MTLPVSQFSYGGFNAGGQSADLRMLPNEGPLSGLSSPPRTTNLADRQGHGREPGAQWATERIISVTVWTDSVETLLAFDAVMAPRPDPTDVLPWVGNFLGLGERLCWVRPESCVWSFDPQASIGMWKIAASWMVADPTIFSADESDLSWGGGGAPVAFADLEVENVGSATSERAWSVRFQAHGTVHDPYIQIQGDEDRNGESVRFTGLTMTGGQVLRIDTRHYAKVGDLSVDGKARSRGQRLVTWPELRPGTQTVRVGCVSGVISGNFHHRSTWSV